MSPEVQEALDALAGVFANTTRDRAVLAALTPGLVPAAESLDAAAAARDMARMDVELPRVRGKLEAAAEALANLSGSTTREGKLLARLLELLNVSVNQSEVQSRVGQIAQQGLPPELQTILQAEGFTGADLSQLQQFISANVGLLGSMNLSQAYSFAGQKHFEAAQGYTLASFKGLENAVYLNKTLGRAKSLLDPELAAMKEEATNLQVGLASASANASQATDFAEIQGKASRLADLSFQLASRSGEFSYADLYNASHNARLAALRGLAGDPAGAARVLRNLTFFPTPVPVATSTPTPRSPGFEAAVALAALAVAGLLYRRR